MDMHGKPKTYWALQRETRRTNRTEPNRCGMSTIKILFKVMGVRYKIYNIIITTGL